jgi:opacity protein-like surface antigen
MKKSLMTTVAAVSLIGFATLAVAQTPIEGDKGGSKPQGAQQEQKATPGGAMMHQQGGAQPTEKTLGRQESQSAQSPSEGTKPDERMGQGRPEDQNKPASARGAQDQSGKSGANVTGQNTKQAPAPRGKSAQLSQDQRTKIQAIIGKGNAPRVSSNANFSITVGATVPRNVHVEVLPEDVVEIVPQYEGFDYVVVGDEILIIDPDTLAIVDIIPV